MKPYRFAVLAAAMAGLVACSEPGLYGDAPETSNPALTVTQAVQVQNMERNVVVRGSIAKVCRDEGCWMTLYDGTTNLHITFRDEAFGMPTSAFGEAIVRGVIREEIVRDTREPHMVATGVRLLQPIE